MPTHEFVKGPIFQVLVVPLVLMAIGVFAAWLGRRDGDDSPKHNDWAVNSTLFLMVIGTILGDLGDSKLQQDEVIDLFAWLVGVFFSIFASLTYDRFASWVPDKQGKPTNAKRLWRGVILPDIVALIVFAAFQAHKAKLPLDIYGLFGALKGSFEFLWGKIAGLL